MYFPNPVHAWHYGTSHVPVGETLMLISPKNKKKSLFTEESLTRQSSKSDINLYSSALGWRCSGQGGFCKLHM